MYTVNLKKLRRNKGLVSYERKSLDIRNRNNPITQRKAAPKSRAVNRSQPLSVESMKGIMMQARLRQAIAGVMQGMRRHQGRGA